MATKMKIFKNKNLIILGISESVSNIGNWITMMAVFAMIVFKGQGGVADSSAVFLAGLLPLLLFSPAAGWLSDRFDRRTLMILSELSSGAVVAGLIFVDQPLWIYTLLALQAVSVSLMSPARQSAIVDIVPPQDLQAANAFLQQLNGIIKIIAPMLAGLILAVMNPHQAVILDVISFALSALILTRLPALRPHALPAAVPHSQPASSSRNALSVIRSVPGLRLLIAAMFLTITIIIGLDVLAPVFTRDVLSGDERLFGLIIGLIGAGTLAVSIFLMLFGDRLNPWRGMVVGVFLLGLIPGTMGLAPLIPDPRLLRFVVMAGCLIGGVGNGLVVIESATLLQRLTPHAFLGRVSGLFQSAAVGGQLTGMLLTPLFVPAVLSLAGYLLAGSALVALLALVTAASAWRSQIPQPGL